MPDARGSRHELSFVAETTPGTTPASPTMKRLRYTGGSPNLTKNLIRSEEMYADRMRRDVRHGNRRVTGDVNFELSYGAMDDWIAAAVRGAWSTNVLKTGILTPAFSVERRFNDITQFLVYKGVQVNTMSLSVKPDEIVKGTFGLIGMDMGTPSGTSLGTPTDVATNPPMDSFSGSINEGGSPIAYITSVELNVNQNIDPTYVVGSPIARQLTEGDADVAGTISAYFPDAVLLNKFIAENESSMTFTLVGIGGSLAFNIPRFKYASADVPVVKGSMVQNLQFEAMRDSTAASNIVITRTVI